MSYLEVFEEIVSIVEHDYVGYEFKKDWERVAYFRNQLVELEERVLLDRDTFKQIADDFLLDYKDAHLVLKDKLANGTNATIGFKVRRYEDKLYVIEAKEEVGIEVGSVIVAIDGKGIEELARKNERQLMGQPIERQLWEPILLQATEITLLDGTSFSIKKYPRTSQKSEYTFKQLNHETVLLTFNDFNDYNQMKELLEEKREALDLCKHIIIDVRKNAGGNDSVWLLLAPYLVPPTFKITSDYGVMIKVTERSFRSRMKEFQAYLDECSDDESLLMFMDLLKKYKNQGLIHVDEFDEELTIDGLEKDYKVRVLTDRYCGSSGDAFVIAAKLSPRVQVIGRATYGVIDYSNVTEDRAGEGFVLQYPTTVMEWVKDGKGYDNVGVTPHTYIPWTPKHLTDDIDLEYVVELLEVK